MLELPPIEVIEYMLDKRLAAKLKAEKSKATQKSLAPEKIVGDCEPPYLHPGGTPRRIMLPNLIGADLHHAKLMLAAIGWVLVVTCLEGEVLLPDMEHVPARISVSVHSGRIIGIERVEAPPEMEEIDIGVKKPI